MGVYKCKVLSRQGGNLISPRVASPIVRLVEAEDRWRTPDHSQVVLPKDWKRAKSYCHLHGAKANDRCKTLALSRDEFRGSGSDVTVDQVA
ncbi:hypothetical protein TNCV_3120261 [Trichonephila clavipes]|uniref:Uncharacterized protein n=1 Tax=Trichonephila clavipes TaxID=2585209 RepID=A0A8X6WB29_TRICX|nr:hypothetical protein TNCV_3120261 [Trichonephila clavipes]